MGRCSPCSTTVLRLYRHLLPSRSRNTVVDGEPVAARCSFLSFLAAGRLLTRAAGSPRESLRGYTEDAEGINLTHLSPPVRSWVYIGGLGKVMSKESAPPMLTCLSIHQQLWINRWIMGIVLWRLIHLIILLPPFLFSLFYFVVKVYI